MIFFAAAMAVEHEDGATDLSPAGEWGIAQCEFMTQKA